MTTPLNKVDADKANNHNTLTDLWYMVIADYKLSELLNANINTYPHMSNMSCKHETSKWNLLNLSHAYTRNYTY